MDLTGLAGTDTGSCPDLFGCGDGINIPVVLFAIDPSKTGPGLPDVLISRHPGIFDQDLEDGCGDDVVGGYWWRKKFFDDLFDFVLVHFSFLLISPAHAT
jgi:hypothetical protein